VNFQTVQCTLSLWPILHLSEGVHQELKRWSFLELSYNVKELTYLLERKSPEQSWNGEGDSLHSLFEIDCLLVKWCLNFSLRVNVDLW
jgi:hypothetical protein